MYVCRFVYVYVYMSSGHIRNFGVVSIVYTPSSARTCSQSLNVLLDSVFAYLPAHLKRSLRVISPYLPANTTAVDL